MFSASLLGYGYASPFCMICGIGVREERSRAVYCTSTGVKVTGIKKDLDRTSIIPEDMSESTSDDPSHQKPDLYYFDEQCWRRLRDHFGPAEFHLTSLYEAMQRLPLPRQYDFSSHVSLPGRLGIRPERYIDDCNYPRPIRPGQFPFPSLEELMRFGRDPPKPLGVVPVPNDVPTDGFQRLPAEILGMISMLLPTQTALDLRLITRAAIPIFASSSFWRSRFDINAERGFLFPIIRKFTTPERKHKIDWRLLYHCTSQLNCSDWFEIEIRAWEARRWLRDTTLAIHSGKTRPLDFRGSALHHYHNTRRRNTHIESVDITSALCQVVISASQDTGDVNITGMEFIFDDGRPNAMLGYSTPGAKEGDRDTLGNGWAAGTDWAYPGIKLTVDVGCLKGIAFIQSANGINSVCIFHDGQDLNEIRRDDLLSVGLSEHMMSADQIGYAVSLDEIKQVIAVVDNRKMIDLGISGITTRRLPKINEHKWEEMMGPYKDPSQY
ncbi:hypothetical protein FE257_001750 [Aspergillus nanangensis]|uniref:F-box domain-containing protein n=1 Tax=Aspergillus nanangensis TaxID=2582783 RepID=A0AAD4GNS4_ASPNN|nr:hypothetical protein FE257_001750 [Aspergillus nanangensis]